jgi:hypothetical protein
MLRRRVVTTISNRDEKGVPAMIRLEDGTWYRAALLCLSLICGAAISMWVNSLSRETHTSAVTKGEAAAGAMIGVDADARCMELVRMMT